MNKYVSATRWWVILPLAAALLGPYFDFMERFCFSLHLNILAGMFGDMALVAFFIDLPAVLAAFALTAGSLAAKESSWFWIPFVPSLVLSVFLYAVSVATRQLWGRQSKELPGRVSEMVLAISFSLCVICLLMALGAAASVSANSLSTPACHNPMVLDIAVPGCDHGHICRFEMARREGERHLTGYCDSFLIFAPN